MQHFNETFVRMFKNVTHFRLLEEGWILNANQRGSVMPNEYVQQQEEIACEVHIFFVSR